MKRLALFACLALLLPATLAAQETVAFRFGCISYNEVLEAMPEYAQIDSDMVELKAKYDAEMTAAEDEFNAKYEAFLDEYAGYTPAILAKRQGELEDMLNRNEAFRDEARRLLQQARDEKVAAVRAKLDAVIADVANEYSLAFVLSADDKAVPFLNAKMAYNITAAVKNIVAQ
ncbi:MAG: OmpH family outer membrane protein [Prevotella sp.]|nr:OmpH family outer membrane protein [Prevotella sp.]